MALYLGSSSTQSVNVLNVGQVYEWRKIAEVTLAEDTYNIEVVTDADGKEFNLNKIMLEMDLHFTKAPTPFTVYLNDINFMLIKSAAGFNHSTNRYMNLFAENTGSGAYGTCPIAAVTSSTGNMGGLVENQTRYASVRSGFDNGINKISLECMQNPVSMGATTYTQLLYYNSNGTERSLAGIRTVEPTGEDAEAVKISFQTYSAYFPYRYSENLGDISQDGVTLKFSNYTYDENSTSEYKGEIAIVLSGFTANDTSKVKARVPFLRLDTKTGTLYFSNCLDVSLGAVSGFENLQEVICDDALRYENITGKRFDVTVRFAENAFSVVNNNYEIVLTIYGDTDEETKTLIGTITNEMFTSLVYHPRNGSFYTSIGGLDNNPTTTNIWSINFHGFENQVYGQIANGSKIAIWGQDK